MESSTEEKEKPVEREYRIRMEERERDRTVKITAVPKDGGAVHFTIVSSELLARWLRRLSKVTKE